MAGNVFATSPLESEVNAQEAAAAPQRRSVLSAPPPPAAGGEPDYHALARQTQVPFNVIQALTDAAGLKDPSQKTRFAADAASRIGAELRKGDDVPTALRTILGKNAPVDEVLTNASALATGKAPSAPAPAKPPAPDENQSALGYVKHGGQRMVNAATDVIGNLPEAAAIASQSGKQERAKADTKGAAFYEQQIADLTHTLNDPKTPDSAKPNLRARIEALQVGVQKLKVDAADKAASGSVPADQTPMFQKGDKIRKAVKNVVGEAPPSNGFLPQLEQGVGSTAGFALGGLVAEALGGPVAGTAAIAGMGASANGAQAYKQAKQQGATEDQALTVAGWNGLMGTSEALPIGHALHMIPNPLVRRIVSKKVFQYLGHVAVNAGEEGVQEGAQQLVQNLVAQKVYNPKQGTFEQVGTNALVGAITGGIISSLGGLRGDHHGEDHAAPVATQPSDLAPAEPAPPAAAPTPPQPPADQQQPEAPAPVSSGADTIPAAAATPSAPEASAALPTAPEETAAAAPAPAAPVDAGPLSRAATTLPEPKFGHLQEGQQVNVEVPGGQPFTATFGGESAQGVHLQDATGPLIIPHDQIDNGTVSITPQTPEESAAAQVEQANQPEAKTGAQPEHMAEQDVFGATIDNAAANLGVTLTPQERALAAERMRTPGNDAESVIHNIIIHSEETPAEKANNPTIEAPPFPTPAEEAARHAAKHPDKEVMPAEAGLMEPQTPKSEGLFGKFVKQKPQSGAGGSAHEPDLNTQMPASDNVAPSQEQTQPGGTFPHEDNGLPVMEGATPQITNGFTKNVYALPNFKKGDRVHWHSSETYKNPDGTTTEGRYFAGTITGIDKKTGQGMVSVKADGGVGGNGHDITIGASQLTKGEPPSSGAGPKTETRSTVQGEQGSGDVAAKLKAAMDGGLVEHTTKKGKQLKGYVVNGLKMADAKAIDPYTFRRDKGHFIRAKDATAFLQSAGETAPEAVQNGQNVQSEQKAAEPAKPAPKRLTPKQAREERMAKLRDYFRPGNIVPSMGGRHDRVLDFKEQPDGEWTTRVQSVVKQDGQWVPAPDSEPRTHRTMPTDREFRAGPTEAAAAPETPAEPAKPATDYGAKNTLVTRDRAEEVRKRLREKLQNQLNSGIDPEVLSLGSELAAYHIEAGARKFVDFAHAVADDLGTTVEKSIPYLRAWYNGARDLMEDSGLSIDGMDSPDQVSSQVREIGKAPAEEAKPKAAEPVKEEARASRRLVHADQPARVRMRRLKTDMLKELRASGIDHKITLNLHPSKITLAPGEDALDGYFLKDTIGVSADAPVGAMGILRHEIIHALRSPDLWGSPYGLFKKGEWQALVQAARRRADIRAWVDSAYPNLSEAKKNEEAVAEMYRQWAEGNRAPNTPAGWAMAKLGRIVRAITSVLRGHGADRAADVFSSITDGTMRERAQQAQPRDELGRFATTTGKTSEDLVPSVSELSPAKHRPPEFSEVKPVVTNDEAAAERSLVGNAVTQAMDGLKGFNSLSLVPGRALMAELGKGIPSVQTYMRTKEQMDTLRNELQAKYDKTGREWRKLAGRNKEHNAELMDIMHEATIEGIDSAEAFAPLEQPNDRELMRKYGPSSKTHQWAKERIEQDVDRRQAYDELKARFAALPEDMQALYRRVRDDYKELGHDFEKAIEYNAQKAMEVGLRRAEREHEKALQRIADEGLTGKAKTDATEEANGRLKTAKLRGGWGMQGRLHQLREQFESNKAQGPYFPLARFGNFYVTSRNAEGQVVSFSKFETEREQQQEAKRMRDEGYQVSVGVMSKTDHRDMVDPTFVADVEKLLENADVDPEVLDNVWQRWLQTLPDLSIRKNRIHRKGQAGHSGDALRAYAFHMFHGAHQLARLRYGLDMSEALDLAKGEADRSKDPNRAGLIVNELTARHEFVMKPSYSRAAQNMTTGSFIYFLGMSPSSAAVNLTQTTVVGVPILAAFHGNARGYAVATRELGRALGDFTRGKGHALESRRLTADEKAAMQEAYDRGTIDKSMSHDLMGISESGVGYNPTRRAIMEKISFLFHHTERLNREVTFLAAYRMARAKGLDHEAAIEKAADLTWKTHFDYQASSRPRVMQNQFVRVFTQFRNFTVNMLWRMFRDMHQSLKGASPEARKEARMQLLGVTGSLLMHAGIRGVWGYALMASLAGLFFPDGKDEFEQRMQKTLVNTLGYRMTGMLLNGVPGDLLRIELTNRIGMPDLWFQSPGRVMNGQDEYQYYIMQALGPTVSIGANLVRGIGQIEGGQVMRGLETVSPKVIHDVLRTVRFLRNGATNHNGDTILDHFTPPELLASALGFTPARLEEQYQINSLKMRYEKRIQIERTNLLHQVRKSIMSGNGVSPELQKEVQAFNAQAPNKITGRSIRSSVRARLMAKRHNEGGVYISPRLSIYLDKKLAPNLYGR